MSDPLITQWTILVHDDCGGEITQAIPAGYRCLRCHEYVDPDGPTTEVEVVPVAERDRYREAFSEYASHASWRCGHPDRYPWEPDCPCGLTKACRDLGVPTHNE